MAFYVLEDGNGSFIRKDGSSGKYVPIRSFTQAKKWDDESKASSILQNSIAKTIRSNYYVQKYATEEIVEKGALPVKSELTFHELEDDNITDWLEKINTIMGVLSDSDDRTTELNDKLSQIDKEIVDVEHYIEFGQFNCYQGWLCFKMLQNKLRQRRRYKNELSVLNMIKNCKISTDSLTTLSRLISESRNKCYTPRAFPELFRSGN